MHEVKKDCFAYMSKYGKPVCSALDKLYCKEEKCGFYKTKKQRQKELHDAEVKYY